MSSLECFIAFATVGAAANTLLTKAYQLDGVALLSQYHVRLLRMLWCPLRLVIALELLTAIGDHFFLAVLADALNAAAVGLPASPLRAMRSLLPASMRLRLAAMLA